MTKRQELGRMFRKLEAFCKRNDIQILAVAGYEDNDENLTCISYTRNGGSLVPMMHAEMEINHHLDECIKEVADSGGRIQLLNNKKQY